MSARTRIVALLTCGGIGALAPVVGAASPTVVANLNTPPPEHDTLEQI